MNYNIDLSILTQALRDGVSQEEIAKTFATALNEASAAIKAEKAKKEEEARKAAENEKKKLQHEEKMAKHKKELEELIKNCIPLLHKLIV